MQENHNLDIEQEIPKQIQDLTAGQSYQIDDIGMSKATVLTYENQILKIEPENPQTDEMVTVMRWLSGKLPVPEILAYEKQD